MIAKQRPKYLDLARIRLPVPGFVSILHRISGAALFLFAGVLLYLFQESLQSPESYVRFRALADQWWMKLFLRQARATSWAVLGISLLLTVILGVCIW